jgi:hypothetical protein
MFHLGVKFLCEVSVSAPLQEDNVSYYKQALKPVPSLSRDYLPSRHGRSPRISHERALMEDPRSSSRIKLRNVLVEAPMVPGLLWDRYFRGA